MMTKAEAIKWLKSLKQEIGKTKNCSLWHYAEAIDMVIEVMSEPKTGEWIPVSEKLPETGGSILVTYSDGEVGIVWSARPKVWGKYEKANNLIFPVAWMPLPEPYREDGEE